MCPYDSNGVFSLTPGYTAVAGQTIQPSQHNPPLEDISASGLSLVLLRDGRAPMTGNLNMNGFKLTNVLAGTNALDAVNKTQLDAQATTQASANRGYIYGLTLSNNAVDATNDIDIAAGAAAQDTASPAVMVLAASITKRLDAAWTVGSGNGGLDTGSIGDNTYHVWLIQRSDTGVVDALFSLSATAPTMPANYDRKRLIMSVIRSSGALLGFKQIGGRVLLSVPFIIRTSTVGATNIQVACVVPTGRRVRPILSSQLGMNASSAGQNSIGDGDSATASFNYQQCNASSIDATVIDFVYTDTSRNVRFSTSASVGTYASNILNSLGWWDDQGANG